MKSKKGNAMCSDRIERRMKDAESRIGGSLREITGPAAARFVWSSENVNDGKIQVSQYVTYVVYGTDFDQTVDGFVQKVLREQPVDTAMIVWRQPPLAQLTADSVDGKPVWAAYCRLAWLPASADVIACNDALVNADI